ITPNGKISTTSASEIDVVAGQTTTADFDFPGGTASLEGRAYTDDNTPMRGTVVIQFERIDGAEDDHFVELTADGRYRAEGLPAGDATLHFMLANYVFAPRIEIPVKLQENAIITQDIFVARELIP